MKTKEVDRLLSKIMEKRVAFLRTYDEEAFLNVYVKSVGTLDMDGILCWR